MFILGNVFNPTNMSWCHWSKPFITQLIYYSCSNYWHYSTFSYIGALLCFLCVSQFNFNFLSFSALLAHTHLSITFLKNHFFFIGFTPGRWRLSVVILTKGIYMLSPIFTQNDLTVSFPLIPLQILYFFLKYRFL